MNTLKDTFYYFMENSYAYEEKKKSDQLYADTEEISKDELIIRISTKYSREEKKKTAFTFHMKRQGSHISLVRAASMKENKENKKSREISNRDSVRYDRECRWADLYRFAEHLSILNMYDEISIFTDVIRTLIYMTFISDRIAAERISEHYRNYAFRMNCPVKRMNEQNGIICSFTERDIADTEQFSENWHPHLIWIFYCSQYKSVLSETEMRGITEITENTENTENTAILKKWFDYITEFNEIPYEDISVHIYNSIISTVDNYHDLSVMILKRYIAVRLEKDHSIHSFPNSLWRQTEAEEVNRKVLQDISAL